MVTMPTRTENVDALIAESNTQIANWKAQRAALWTLLDNGESLTAEQRKELDSLAASIDREAAYAKDLQERRRVAVAADAKDAQTANYQQVCSLVDKALKTSAKASSTVDAEVDSTAEAFIAALLKRAAIRRPLFDLVRDAASRVADLETAGAEVRAAQKEVATAVKAEDRQTAAGRLQDAIERHRMSLRDHQAVLDGIVAEARGANWEARQALASVIDRALAALEGNVPAAPAARNVVRHTFASAGETITKTLTVRLRPILQSAPTATKASTTSDDPNTFSGLQPKIGAGKGALS